MTYNTAKYITIKDPFSTWLIDNESSWNIPDWASPYLRNARIGVNGIEIRPGHQLFKDIGGTGQYLNIVGWVSLVAKRWADFFFYNQSGTQLATTTFASFNDDALTNFEKGQGNIIYGFNGVEEPAKIDSWAYTVGAMTLTRPSGIGAWNFKPLFGRLFNGSMWVSWVPSNPSVVYKSVGKSYEDYGWAGSDSLTFSSNIVGLATNSQSIFYFSKEGISCTSISDIVTASSGAVSYFSRPVTTQEGSVNHKSIVTAGDDVYYLTPSNKISRLMRGNNVYGFENIQLSNRANSGIDKIMSSLDADQTYSFGYYLPFENLIKWHVRKQGSTFNDVCIIYDIIHDWFFIDSNKYFQDWVYWNGYNFTASDLETKIFKDEYGQDDDDTPIQFDYYTKKFNLGNGTFKKIFWETRSFLKTNALAEITQEIYIDDVLVDTYTFIGSTIPDTLEGVWVYPIADTPIWDETEDGNEEMVDIQIIRQKSALRKKGKSIQFRWTCDSLAGKLALQWIDIKTELLSPRTTNWTTGQHN